MKGIPQQVVEVHGVILPEPGLVFSVNAVYNLALKVFPFLLQIFLRTAVCLFFLADNCPYVIYRVLSGIDIQILENVFQQSLLIHRIIYNKVFFVPCSFIILSENSETHGMECENPHPRTYTCQPLHSLAHFCSCLVGEGNCKNLVGAYALLYEISYSVRHCSRLSASCSCQYKQRAFCAHSRFFLSFIQIV